MRSRGTPRIATACSAASATTPRSAPTETSTAPTAQAALAMLEVDAHGFDELDRRLLRTIIEKYERRPGRLNTLAAALCEEQDASKRSTNPSHPDRLLDRTPRGRVATRSLPTLRHRNAPQTQLF